LIVIMEFHFDQLLACSIKRLTRPKWRHDFTQFNDPNFSAEPLTGAELAKR